MGMIWPLGAEGEPSKKTYGILDSRKDSHFGGVSSCGAWVRVCVHHLVSRRSVLDFCYSRPAEGMCCFEEGMAFSIARPPGRVAWGAGYLHLCGSAYPPGIPQLTALYPARAEAENPTI